jgi:stage II sporulation protein D
VKKTYSFLFFVILFLYFPVSSKALETVTYSNPVKVLVYKGTNASVSISGNYQILNKQKMTITPLSDGTTLTFRYSLSGVSVVYDKTSDFSSTGFIIQETKGPARLSLVKVNTTRYRGGIDVSVQNGSLQITNILGMEDYLKGVVPNEMPASWPKEALKAQAISARSYAYVKKNQLTTTPNTQTYKGYDSEDARTNEAVEATKGLLVKYQGRVIETYYHSTSGGRTANVGDVWNSNQSSFPYLVSVDDPYESSPHSRWSFTFSPSTILKSFNISNPSAILYDMSITKTGANGEVGAVTIKTSEGTKTIKGNENQIRKLFPLPNGQYYGMLPSNWFDIKVNKEGQLLFVQTSQGKKYIASINGQRVQTKNNTITISEDANVKVQTAAGLTPISSDPAKATSITVTGKGWGHRIGMSQYGAKAFAEKGWTAKQILEHYYKGAVVSY